MIKRFLFIPTLMFLLFPCLISAQRYEPWSDNVFVHIGSEYGTEAEKRMRYLHEIILNNQDISVDEKLQLVNKTLNRLPWIADKDHWENIDYWAAPMETLTTFGGDCEDIAIAKWIMLRHLGVSAEHLRLVYVKVKKRGESHMVLAYIPNLDETRQERMDSALILDNYNKKIVPFSERTDLLAIYATDAKGGLAVVKDDGNKRRILGIKKNRQLQKIEEVKQKIYEDMRKYQELNDGRPLHPY